MKGWQVSANRHDTIADGDADSYRFLGTLAKVKATADQTGGAFSVVEFEHPAGFATRPHVHGTSRLSCRVPESLPL